MQVRVSARCHAQERPVARSQSSSHPTEESNPVPVGPRPVVQRNEAAALAETLTNQRSRLSLRHGARVCVTEMQEQARKRLKAAEDVRYRRTWTAGGGAEKWGTTTLRDTRWTARTCVVSYAIAAFHSRRDFYNVMSGWLAEMGGRGMPDPTMLPAPRRHRRSTAALRFIGSHPLWSAKQAVTVSTTSCMANGFVM